MKRAILMTAALSGLATSASAFNLMKPRVEPAVVGYDIKLERRQGPVGGLQKRGSVDVPVYQGLDAFSYTVNVSVGTPPQPLTMQLDTGSADFLAVHVNDLFNISYASGDSASGSYFSDTLLISGKNLTDLTIGLGNMSTSSQNVWGIRMELDEAGLGYSAPYANSVFLMFHQGLIQSSTYSLCLDDISTSSGSILFGGIDTSKFTGSLTILPTTPYAGSGQFVNSQVALDAVSITSGGQTVLVSGANSSISSTALLSSDTPLLTLPPDIATQIYTTLGIHSISGAPAVPCTLATSPATINFTFQTLTIPIPIRSLVLRPVLHTLVPAAPALPPAICAFAIAPATPNFGPSLLLGDPLLRQAYVVYDLLNRQIGIAQASRAPGAPDVVEIANGTNGIATAVADGTATSRSRMEWAATEAGGGEGLLRTYVAVLAGVAAVGAFSLAFSL